eukprot:4740227-Prymnesium_polylepis.1
MMCLQVNFFEVAARERRYYFWGAKPVHRHRTFEHAQRARNTRTGSHITVPVAQRGSAAAHALI